MHPCNHLKWNFRNLWNTSDLLLFAIREYSFKHWVPPAVQPVHLTTQAWKGAATQGSLCCCLPEETIPPRVAFFSPTSSWLLLFYGCIVIFTLFFIIFPFCMPFIIFPFCMLREKWDKYLYLMLHCLVCPTGLGNEGHGSQKLKRAKHSKHSTDKIFC